MSKERTPIAEGSEWTFQALEDFEREIGRIAADTYHLDTYPNQIEIIFVQVIGSAPDMPTAIKNDIP